MLRVQGEPGGEYLNSRFVGIYHSAADGSLVRYTTDGSEPTSTHGAIGTNLTVHLNTLVKAVAFRPGEGATTASTVMLPCNRSRTTAGL